MPDTPSIDILLATYNGAKYLDQQLQSLLAQTYQHWRLIVRDDGSSDTTLKLLLNFAQKYPDKIFIVKDTKGSLRAKMNFSELITYSQAAYTMFCDQDDVWLPNKIELSLKHLQKLEAEHGIQEPLLVYTDLKVVNDQLGVIHESMWDYTQIVPERDQKWNRLLTVNPAVGCTVMFNQSLRNVVTLIPHKAVMHDWWLALVACFFGHLDFIPQATMLYRQHQNNVVGARVRKKKTPLEYFNQDTLSTMRTQLQQAQKQMEAFVEIYHGTLG